MKSIMEQASSIIKAIEKAWISADKPKEFSVKIFEKEEKNFFGMTTKPAKIGIFFSEKSSPSQEKYTHKTQHEIKEQPQRQQQQEHKPKHVAEAAPVVKKQQQTINNKHIRTEKPKTETAAQPQQQQRTSATWTESMIDAATAWINKTLALSNIDAVHFTPEVAGKILKISFSKPVIENQATEKQLFRSAAYLIMSSLRNQYKQHIKDLKIVLIRPE